MNREEFIEKKRLEIQEEVDFLKTEKSDAYRESVKLYEDIRDKIAELKHCVKKEELANKRLKLISESGTQTYGVYVDSVLGTPYFTNRSLRYLDSLAKSKFDIEEFGGLLEEKEGEKAVEHKTTAAMQRESNQLLSSMVSVLEQIKDNSKDVTIDGKKLIESMTAKSLWDNKDYIIKENV